MNNVLQFTPRNREGAGHSRRSWIKHNFVAKIAASYIAAYRTRHPDDRILLIDGNAGDGKGVEKDVDLFDRSIMSKPTPQILMDCAEFAANADIVLCEMDQHKRKELWKQFPETTIVASHPEIISQLRPYHRYAVWISDPCGPKGHGIEQMRQINRRVMCDFIVILNEGSIKRVMGTTSDKWKTSRQLYGSLIDAQWWLTQLDKRWVAQSDVIRASPNFHYRVWAISDFLADCTKRPPFTQHIERNPR